MTDKPPKKRKPKRSSERPLIPPGQLNLAPLTALRDGEGSRIYPKPITKRQQLPIFDRRRTWQGD